jgi:hypothetical protein
VQGAQVRAGIEAWAAAVGVRLTVVDDGSQPERAVEAHSALAAAGCRFVLGPYGSDSTRAVARAGSDAAVWNHGGAADDVQRLPGVVSVPSPASRYLVALGRAVVELRPGAAVSVLAAPGRFARFVREGLEREADSLGVTLVAAVDEADAVLCCGPPEWEAERLRSVRGSRVLLGGLAPGLRAFPWILRGDPDGMLAPVQWHPDVPVQPNLGPASAALDDYVAAQTYAAAIVADHCIRRAPDDPLAAARRLRATTFFGAFQLAADGLQIGHRLSVIRWRSGRQELLLPNAA